MSSAWPPGVGPVILCTSLYGWFWFTTKMKLTEKELRSLSTNIVELANESRGEHRASREAGDGAHCG